MKTLITLLGRTAKAHYDTLTYHFPDGDSRQAAFLGWPLMERLEPERMIVLGTKTSFWDHLFEGDLDLGDAGENRRMALIEAITADQPIEQETLDELAPLLERALGHEVRLIIIPEGVDAADQIRIFEVLERQVPDGCELHLDCTHIGVGKAKPPRPPNRTCGSPAYGSPVGGFLIGIDAPRRELHRV